jgi:GrpB-like predicted nucleotidyltransferase (UPF0157 family)
MGIHGDASVEFPRTIRVVPHDPKWTAAFEEERARLDALLGKDLVAVHHIGSTAIPGIPAKPIIDVLVVVRAIESVDEKTPAMVGAGYRSFGEFGIPGRRYFVRGFDPARTHHVHVYGEGTVRIADHLEFRDYMIAHPERAAAYGRLKVGLARRFPHNIEGYMRGKDEFIRETIDLAARWARRGPAGA